jgi:hypothetical protein
MLLVHPANFVQILPDLGVGALGGELVTFFRRQQFPGKGVGEIGQIFSANHVGGLIHPPLGYITAGIGSIVRGQGNHLLQG